MASSRASLNLCQLCGKSDCLDFSISPWIIERHMLRYVCLLQTRQRDIRRCDLPAKFVDREQMSVQELMALKRMPHRTLDGHLHNL